jgi:hypothetical protein
MKSIIIYGFLLIEMLFLPKQSVSQIIIDDNLGKDISLFKTPNSKGMVPGSLYLNDTFVFAVEVYSI